MSYPSDETIRMLHNIRDYAYTIWVRSQWLMTDVDIIQQRQRLRDKPVEPRKEEPCSVSETK